MDLVFIQHFDTFTNVYVSWYNKGRNNKSK